MQEEADNFYLISTVEILSHTNNVKMLADEILIYPNIRPQNSTLFGIDIPGTKVQSLIEACVVLEDLEKCRQTCYNDNKIFRFIGVQSSKS